MHITALRDDDLSKDNIRPQKSQKNRWGGQEHIKNIAKIHEKKTRSLLFSLHKKGQDIVVQQYSNQSTGSFLKKD